MQGLFQEDTLGAIAVQACIVCFSVVSVWDDLYPGVCTWRGQVIGFVYVLIVHCSSMSDPLIFNVIGVDVTYCMTCLCTTEREHASALLLGRRIFLCALASTFKGPSKPLREPRKSVRPCGGGDGDAACHRATPCRGIAARRVVV